MRYITKIDPRLKIDNILGSQIVPQIVYLVGDISEDSAAQARRDLEDAESSALTTGQKVIPLVIDSDGGCVYALFSIFDAIDACKLPIATIVEGKAFSAAAALFTAGTEGYRYIGPNATIMIHDIISIPPSGKTGEIKVDAKETERLNEAMLERMSKNCGHKKDYFSKAVHHLGHSDWYLDAKECKQRNIANHIRIPCMTLEIKMTHRFN